MNCSEDSCEDQVHARSFCERHYQKAYRSGKLATAPYVDKFRKWTVNEVLLECDRVGECLVWKGSPKSNYPELKHDGKAIKVHRFVYWMHTGEDIKNLTIHHICANSRCVNPSHLQRAAHADNVLEMLARKDYEAEITRLKAEVAQLRALLLEREVACG